VKLRDVLEEDDLPEGEVVKTKQPPHMMLLRCMRELEVRTFLCMELMMPLEMIL
jgi:hypothetical protein